jgi:acetyl-CoA C-acetyltransferase
VRADRRGQEPSLVFGRSLARAGPAREPGHNDGAVALALMEEDAARAAGRRILGRIVSYAHSGVDPALMGISPIESSRKALAKAGIAVTDLKVVESNEAFAAQACAVSRELGLLLGDCQPERWSHCSRPSDRRDGRGSAVKALYELERLGGGYGL